MRKTVMVFWLVILNLLLFANVSIAANISNANYGSVVVRDGVFNNIFGRYAVGHAGVVIQPLFGKSPKPTDYMIAQASGVGLSNVAKYYGNGGFLGSNSNHYIGQFKTSDSQWNSPAFRADVVKFANQAMGKSYIFLALYSYSVLTKFHVIPLQDSSGHWPDLPYWGVTPSYFRCDGVAEWSVEQALGHNGRGLNQKLGFFSNNSLTNNPISISTLGIDDSAFSLQINSDSPSSGVVVRLNKADSMGQ